MNVQATVLLLQTKTISVFASLHLVDNNSYIKKYDTLIKHITLVKINPLIPSLFGCDLLQKVSMWLWVVNQSEMSLRPPETKGRKIIQNK